MSQRIALPAITCCALALSACGDARADRAAPTDQKQPLGLVTSLPIYWAEAGSIEEQLAVADEPPWVRTALEEHYHIVPLDTLARAGSAGEPQPQLAQLDRLLLAQPAALPPADLVAIDTWLRDGGRALIFADPMLSGGSRFAIGDRRRPQDVVTLDPLLSRWGLQLQFDGAQPAGPRQVQLDGPVTAASLVDLAGYFTLLTRPDVPAQCTLHSQGLLADCQVGAGRALIVADAALLEGEAHDEGSAHGTTRAALAQLTQAAFEVR